MPEEPEVMEEQTQEPAPEQPESPAETDQKPDETSETPEETSDGEASDEEETPKERRSILLPILYALVVLMILVEGFVVYAWWSAVSEAQTAEARQAAKAADRSDLSGSAYSNRYGTYRPNNWPEGSAIYAGGYASTGSGSGQGQVVDSQEPTELTGPVDDIGPEGGD